MSSVSRGRSAAAAAAAKSLQSCPTLCNPIDGSPPGSPVPGILQARTLESLLGLAAGGCASISPCQGTHETGGEGSAVSTLDPFPSAGETWEAGLL